LSRTEAGSIQDQNRVRGLAGRVVGMPRQFAGAFGLVGAPLSRVSDEMFKWHAQLGFRPRRRLVDVGLNEAANLLLPLDKTPYLRNLLVGTRSARWTAYFDATPSGGDPRGAVSVLGSRLRAPYVVVYATPFGGDSDAIPGTLGGLQWEYSPDGSASNQRAIALVEGEGSRRFHFEAWGPLQAWETPEAYTARDKRQRLTIERVAQYCRAVGIEPFDPDFYVGPSVLVERTS
jgi:hypothetical protein